MQDIVISTNDLRYYAVKLALGEIVNTNDVTEDTLLYLKDIRSNCAIVIKQIHDNRRKPG